MKAYAQTLHELRQQVEGKDAESRALPPNEKAIRLRKLAKDLPGVEVEGLYEPSARLIDQAYAGVQMLAIPYLPWNACTSRLDENKGQQKTNLSNQVVQWVADDNGLLHEKPFSVKAAADLS
eukprot:2103626-Amphidinium_carterae.1